MAKLRHVAIAVPDVEKAAAFYQQAFDMQRVGEAKGPTADGVYLSDGTVNLALLHYKSDEPMGPGRTREWMGVHHIGFWVDDTEAQRRKVEQAGGAWMMGEMEGTGIFYELKYTDPFGNVLDLTHNGWGGAVKDGPAPAGAAQRTKRVTKARRVIAAGKARPARKAAAKRGSAKTAKKPAKAKRAAVRAAPKRRAAAARSRTRRTARRG